MHTKFMDVEFVFSFLFLSWSVSISWQLSLELKNCLFYLFKLMWIICKYIFDMEYDSISGFFLRKKNMIQCSRWKKARDAHLFWNLLGSCTPCWITNCTLDSLNQIPRKKSDNNNIGILIALRKKMEKHRKIFFTIWCL